MAPLDILLLDGDVDELLDEAIEDDDKLDDVDELGDDVLGA
jgi:hypothetical protein